jgi:glycosyltransferase involved in cell wall biosynthesis
MITDTVIDYKINLHFITDSEYCKIGTSTFCSSTYSVLKEVFKNSNVNINVYNWNSLTFSSIAIKCDIAIIPIPNDPVMKRKPENKLILLWSLGIPVVASRTSSYDRVMKSINQDFLCDDISDWNIKILELANSKEIRERYMSNANIYLENQHSRNSILKIWESVFFVNR